MKGSGELFIKLKCTTNEATRMIGNEANQRVPRVTRHLSLRMPTPFNDMNADKTPN